MDPTDPTTVFLTTAAVVGRWGVSARTLEGYRAKGIGPNFIKIGNRVRYRLSDIERFVDRSRAKPHVDLVAITRFALIERGIDPSRKPRASRPPPEPPPR